MRKKTGLSLTLAVAAFLGLGAVALSETNASAACYSGKVNACSVYGSFTLFDSNGYSLNCTTPQAKWCDRVNPTGTFWYTKVLYRNWGTYSEVKWAADRWNAATTPSGGGNSLGLIASTASSNDIDIENVNWGANGRWGVTTMPGGVTGGCFNNNAGNIKLNVYYMNQNANWRKHTASHELGHALGLGHTSQAHVMNPNGVYYLTDDCDEAGIERLYP